MESSKRVSGGLLSLPPIGRAWVMSPMSIQELAMHYPHRVSRLKRKRSIGFRARMKTTNGRKMMNRKRAAGRSLNVADK